ncbi:hypothetical protein [Burkholderia ambifaria]|uniref:hypothetical protein n=1 Tax=Burkholderia ambifaria TaxID=152480 RepID=UPI000F802C57|nr:hypothetical protein [Burkholderia ambifaria]
MTGYERIVHDISIRHRYGAANRRLLNSLSDITCAVSESADKRDRRSTAAVQSAGRAGHLRRVDAMHKNRRIGPGALCLTQDFDRSKLLTASASREGSIVIARMAVPRLGVAWQSFQSFAGHAHRESRARADPAIDRRGGTQGVVDRAQTRFGASYAGRPFSP